MGRASREAKLAALSLVFLCLFYVSFRFVRLRELRETIRKNDIREGADGDTEFQTVSRALQPSSKSALPSR